MSSLNIKQLEAFVRVSEHRNFGKAARTLGITQPAVSARIRELEAELGVELFQRSARTVSLSPQGCELFRYAEKIVGLATDLRKRASHFSHVYGTVRVGATHSVALSWLPEFLNKLRASHKGLNVELTVDLTAALNKMLEDGRLDAAFVVKPTSALAGVSYTPLSRGGLTWACSTKSKYLPDIITPDVLADIPVITDGPGSQIYQMTLDWFVSAGVVPSRLDTCAGPSRAQLVASGHWVGVLPSGLLSPGSQVRQIRILESRPKLGSVEYGIAFRRECNSVAIDEIVSQAMEHSAVQ